MRRGAPRGRAQPDGGDVTGASPQARVRPGWWEAGAAGGGAPAETPGRCPAGPDGREGGDAAGKPTVESGVPRKCPCVSGP